MSNKEGTTNMEHILKIGKYDKSKCKNCTNEIGTNLRQIKTITTLTMTFKSEMKSPLCMIKYHINLHFQIFGHTSNNLLSTIDTDN